MPGGDYVVVKFARWAFEKFKGVLEMRELKNSGKAENLFNEYSMAFDPNQPNISDAEKKLREGVQAEIAKKKKEFFDNLDKVLNVSRGQLELYDDLADQPKEVREKAIETISNLEKLTSPTTWVTPKGKAALDHLQVVRETRIPWAAHVENGSIVFHCDQFLPKNAHDLVKKLAEATGATLQTAADGSVRLTMPLDRASGQMDGFSEKIVAQLTHPDEYVARQGHGDPLAAAKNYVSPVANAKIRPVSSNRPPFAIPNELEVQVDGKTYKFVKNHYEQMLQKTPNARMPQSVDELKSILAAKISRGRQIIASVLAGKHSYQPTVGNAACVTLALHAATVAKGEYNDRGAFSIEDKDGHLYRWLDGCREVYMRTSTHAKAYHHRQIDGHMNMPRGLDIPQGIDGLMGGMKTFHYFALPEANGKSRRLYLKCETYGIYNSTISKKEIEDSRASGMQLRLERSNDKIESAKHCASLLSSITRQGESKGNRKESVPKTVLNVLEKCQKDLTRAGLGELARTLGKDVGGKIGGGIRQLLENVSTILTQSTSSVVSEAYQEIMRTVTAYAEENWDDGTRKRSGDFAARIGNEVMLDAGEIA